MIDDLPIIRAAFDRTVRLVTTARLREAVLQPLVDNADELSELSELESATSTRLIAQQRGISEIEATEFVYDVPHAKFINASFAYAKPREPNRFNGPNRGAWYSALAVETALAEVTFHMTEFLGRTSKYRGVVDYAEMFASMAGEFVDIRNTPKPSPCLDPNKLVGYPAGNALAESARAKGLNGIVYPSVRQRGGTCIVALRPHAVQSVAQGDVYRLSWDGNPQPKIEKV